jgi:hypothetical protein
MTTWTNATEAGFYVNPGYVTKGYVRGFELEDGSGTTWTVATEASTLWSAATEGSTTWSVATEASTPWTDQ